MISSRRVLILAILLMGAGVSLHFGQTYGHPVPMHRSLQDFPLALGNWRGVDFRLDSPMVKALGVETYLHRLYRRSGMSLWLYVGYYETQRQGETVHSPRNCLPGAGWNIIEADLVRIPRDSHEIGPAINRYIVQNGHDRQMVFYWYQCRGRVITNDYWSRIYLVVDAVTRRRTDGSLIRISVPVREESEDPYDEALQQGLDFTRLVFPELAKFIPN
ncbi:MAG: EpsI family protein [Acidobacteria bacterium]|nr:EpsI family protein [Acidobacteriota bacterium]